MEVGFRVSLSKRNIQMHNGRGNKAVKGLFSGFEYFTGTIIPVPLNPV
jgi:hypothetical protein